ncbi:hypothetical protein BD809_105272 [Aquimarina intermedia]|uniref:Uncharacterized protein n=2 Tax=Aquimarina intermedia TaxID=350814 RepID=A0A5S5C2P1_9FLAO|nr:hypothetical protein BD809_105272 [Aquimarina intermedia]
MEASNTEIYNHDNDLDVTHKINTIELKNWINHLQYINKELNNLISLCSEELNGKLKDESVLDKFKKKETENDHLLNAFSAYMLSREKITECEDTKCDMVFITEHESYRRSYLYHLDKYRRLKDEFFIKVQGQQLTLLNRSS